MSQQERISKPSRQEEDDQQTPEINTAVTQEVIDKVGETATGAVSDIDELLNEIEAELEKDAEVFVAAFRQKGGQ